LELKPDSHPACINRAVAKAKREDYRGAIADFDAAISAEARRAEAYFGRASAKRRLEQYAPRWPTTPPP
jgi:hypothetical protein